MNIARRRAPIAARLLVVTALLVLPAAAAAQNAYRGLAPEALLRAAELAPAGERPAILDAFLASRSAALPVLRASARTGGREAKLIAIGMLAEMRDGGAVPALLDASRDGDEAVARSALAALRTLGDGRAAAHFRQLVRLGSGGAQLKIAAAGLGRIGSAADAADLRALLAHADGGVRVTAAGALAMLGSDEGEGVLLDAVDGDDPLAQKNATYALGFVQTPAAAARLQRILDDPDGRWKSYAQIALTQRQRPVQTAAEELAALVLLGRGRDRVAADWAIDQLTDLDHPNATEALHELGARRGGLGTKARLRAKAREGR